MIIGIAGFGGSGKTLLAVGVARYLQLNGYKVITNILSYKYRDYDLITELPEVMTNIRKNPDEIKIKRIALIDEIQNILDSRDSMHTSNKRLSRLIFQLRKARIDLIYTLQDYLSVDIRLRRITERVLFPEYDEIDNLLKITITDKNGTYIGHSKVKINPKLYELYDTYEFLDIDTNIDLEDMFTTMKKSKK